jgi:cell division cycle 20-like protein 1 (cofactor of APC complex)
MAESEELFSSNELRSPQPGEAESLHTPTIGTPPRASTPPLVIEKRKSERKPTNEASNRSERHGRPEAIDPNVLSKALLKEFEDAGKHRDITPGGSPSRKRQRVYGDRYVDLIVLCQSILS